MIVRVRHHHCTTSLSSSMHRRGCLEVTRTLRPHQLWGTTQDRERGPSVWPPYFVACRSSVCGMPHRQASEDPVPSRSMTASYKVAGAHAWDICRPIALVALSGNRYFLLLVDDFSIYMWVVLLPTKDGAPIAIKNVQAAAERKSG
jgi:hypothetical protein